MRTEKTYATSPPLGWEGGTRRAAAACTCRCVTAQNERRKHAESKRASAHLRVRRAKELALESDMPRPARPYRAQHNQVAQVILRGTLCYEASRVSAFAEETPFVRTEKTYATSQIAPKGQSRGRSGRAESWKQVSKRRSSWRFAQHTLPPWQLLRTEGDGVDKEGRAVGLRVVQAYQDPRPSDSASESALPRCAWEAGTRPMPSYSS